MKQINLTFLGQYINSRLTFPCYEALNLMSKQENASTSTQAGAVTIPLLSSVTNLGAKIDNRCDMEKHAIKMCTNLQMQTFIYRVSVR